MHESGLEHVLHCLQAGCKHRVAKAGHPPQWKHFTKHWFTIRYGVQHVINVWLWFNIDTYQYLKHLLIIHCLQIIVYICNHDVSMCCSGNWTHDLSHQKRESYHWTKQPMPLIQTTSNLIIHSLHVVETNNQCRLWTLMHMLHSRFNMLEIFRRQLQFNNMTSNT